MSQPQKQTVFGPIKTDLEDGQRYVDEPVYKEVPVYCGVKPMLGKVTRYYQRIPLRWMKPGPDGKPVPRG